MLTLISTVLLLEFKKEFRFVCINESKKILEELNPVYQKILLADESEKKPIQSIYNQLSYKKAYELKLKLSRINESIDYLSLEFHNPKIESLNPFIEASDLVYTLNYKYLKSYELRLNCGAKLNRKANKWDFEIIY